MQPRIHVRLVPALPHRGQFLFESVEVDGVHTLVVSVLESRVKAEDVPRLERALQAECDQVVGDLVGTAA